MKANTEKKSKKMLKEIFIFIIGMGVASIDINVTGTNLADSTINVNLPTGMVIGYAMIVGIYLLFLQWIDE